jgi:hypothetical protein
MDNAINIESKPQKDWRERQKELKRKKMNVRAARKTERKRKEKRKRQRYIDRTINGSSKSEIG